MLKCMVLLLLYVQAVSAFGSYVPVHDFIQMNYKSNIWNTKVPSNSLVDKNNPYYNFSYSLNPSHSLCNFDSSADPSGVLVSVLSTPTNFKRRDFIRKMIGQHMRSINFRVAFFIGTPVKNSVQFMTAIEHENNVYNDIIQSTFIDTYYNLATKWTSIVKWASMFCGNMSYLVHIDDDVMINTFAVRRFITSIAQQTKRDIYCHMYFNAFVNRDPKSKFFVAYNEYTSKTFPIYCWGGFFILSKDAVKKLWIASYKVPPFKIGDVYITGLLPALSALSFFKVNDKISPSPVNPSFFKNNMKNLAAHNSQSNDLLQFISQ